MPRRFVPLLAGTFCACAPLSGRQTMATGPYSPYARWLASSCVIKSTTSNAAVFPNRSPCTKQQGGLPGGWDLGPCSRTRASFPSKAFWAEMDAFGSQAVLAQAASRPLWGAAPAHLPLLESGNRAENAATPKTASWMVRR